MSRLPLPLDDKALAERSRELLCAVKFVENRKANFDSLMALMKRASYFLDAKIGKKTVYLVGFEKTPQQASLAMNALEEMRISGWTYLLFANGGIQRNKAATLNMLDCYSVASKLKDHRHHCQRKYDDPNTRFFRSSFLVTNVFDVLKGMGKDVNPQTWTLPCQHIEGFISMSAEEFLDPWPKIEAAAVKRGVVNCPLFDEKGFEIKFRSPASGKPKKYW